MRQCGSFRIKPLERSLRRYTRAKQNEIKQLRADHVLHGLDVEEWTDAEGFEHLRSTFKEVCEQWRDLMAPYVTQLKRAVDQTEMKQIMRRGLRETFNRRWPSE